MTGRERLLSILGNAPTDRVAWTTLVDDTTRSAMPPSVREMPVLDFYAHIGCDVLQFGNYGLPPELRVPSPARLVTPPIETEWATEPNGLAVRRQTTPWGTLMATFRSGHPIRRPVDSLAALRVLKEIWAASRYEEAEGTEAACARAEAAIGQHGILIPTLEPSPVQQLVEMDMGLAAFTYLLEDHRDEVEALLGVMHACRMQEYQIVARRWPAAAMIPVENTSTSLISPALYRRYSLPQIRDFVRVAHAHGRKAILHMCGLLRGLLPELAETGLDGIHALTPPPVGDVGFEEALDALGDRLILLGGIFDGSLFHRERVTREEIWRALDAVFTPRLRRASFLLWLGADGLPTPLERFLAVRDWVEERGGAR